MFIALIFLLSGAGCFICVMKNDNLFWLFLSILIFSMIAFGECISNGDIAAEDNERYQTNNFDYGWYQIKALAKEYAKEDFEEFKVLFKALPDKMLPVA